MQSRISKNCRAPSRVMYFLCHLFYLYVLIKSSNIWFDTEAPPHPFVYHFWKRRYTFCIPSIEKWCTLHIPSREIYIPSYCIFEQIAKPERRFLDFFIAIKCASWPFWDFLQTEMTNHTLPFHIFELLKSLPFSYTSVETENPAFPRTGNHRPPPGFYTGTWNVSFIFSDLTHSPLEIFPNNVF